MADVKQAVDFVLRQEDSMLSGIITNIPGDNGGTTRFGLTAAAHPELVAAGFYDSGMNAAAALPLAEQVYESGYATPLLIEQIADQGVATALLSFAVNEESTGVRGPAVKLLQEATVALGASITVDGDFGPASLAAVNACDASALMAGYCNLQAGHYHAIVAANPTQHKFLAGWMNRVAAVQDA